MYQIFGAVPCVASKIACPVSQLIFAPGAIPIPPTCAANASDTQSPFKFIVATTSDNNRKSVTLVHKGNIMKFTEGAFKQWGYDLAQNEFGDKVFTWQQYDKIVEEEGKDKANAAQET